MQLSEGDEKELQRLADEMDSITQKLRAFRQRKGNLDGIQITTEYINLSGRLDELKKVFDSITWTVKRGLISLIAPKPGNNPF